MQGDKLEAIARVQSAWSAVMREFGGVFGDIDSGYYAEISEMRDAIAALTPPVAGGEFVMVPREALNAALRHIAKNAPCDGILESLAASPSRPHSQAAGPASGERSPPHLPTSTALDGQGETCYQAACLT